MRTKEARRRIERAHVGRGYDLRLRCVGQVDGMYAPGGCFCNVTHIIGESVRRKEPFVSGDARYPTVSCFEHSCGQQLRVSAIAPDIVNIELRTVVTAIG